MKDWVITIALVILLLFACVAMDVSIEIDVLYKLVLIGFGFMILFPVIKGIWNLKYRPESKEQKRTPDPGELFADSKMSDYPLFQ